MVLNDVIIILFNFVSVINPVVNLGLWQLVTLTNIMNVQLNELMHKVMHQ